jgi:hypothetical protein
MVKKGNSQMKVFIFIKKIHRLLIVFQFESCWQIVSLLDLELEQLDVKKIFLLGDLDEEIYIEQEKGFV